MRLVFFVPWRIILQGSFSNSVDLLPVRLVMILHSAEEGRHRPETLDFQHGI